MAEDLVIAISPEGRVDALHMDGFDLSFLGKMKVRRQTDIRFCDSTQLWDIHYIAEDGSETATPALQGFGTYEEARRFEVSWINSCRVAFLVADSAPGLDMASRLRAL